MTQNRQADKSTFHSGKDLGKYFIKMDACVNEQFRTVKAFFILDADGYSAAPILHYNHYNLSSCATMLQDCQVPD